MGKILKQCQCESCGETDEACFYNKRKSTCKKCLLKQLKVKYDNMDDDEKKVKFQKQNEWTSKNLIRFRVLSAKHRAIRKKIPFEIDDAFISELMKKQKNRCFYSNIEFDITNIGSKKNQINLNTLSIDRIDSNKGYVKDNVVLVTGLINLMKHDLSDEEFRNIIRVLYLNTKPKNPIKNFLDKLTF
jgi:hypothetical protein